MNSHPSRRSPIITFSFIALLIAATPILVQAGHQTSGVASYTGCLRSGIVYNVAVGDSPLAACRPGDVQVHVSGGDITGVAAGQGLAGGGANGATTLSVDTNAIQARVTGSCTSGNAIPVINANGTVTCEPVGGGSSRPLLWVGAGSDGSVLSSSDPNILVIKFSPPAVGQYQVRFPLDVHTCAPVATIGRNPSDLNTDSGLISASSFFGTNVTDIEVLTRGFNNFTFEDKPFSLAVFC